MTTTITKKSRDIMAKQDYYALLGIAKGATDEEIKKAYRANVKKYHPDSNPGDATAEAKFKEINEAYTVLSDADKRAKYVQFGHAATGADFGAGGFGGFGGGFNNFADFADIVNDLNIFGTRRRKRGPEPGASVEVALRIGFEEAIFGVEKEIEVAVKDTCDACKGSGAKAGTTAENCRTCSGTGRMRQGVQTGLGYIETTTTCRTCRGAGKIIKDACAPCHGSGKVAKPRKIAVSVPKGIDHGQSIRFTGQGEAGEVGAPKGDLFVRILVASHGIYSRQGSHLYMEKEISFAQAALGSEIVIPTPHGDETHRLAVGTQPETVITLRGKGVPHVNAPSRMGDMIVTLKLVVPRILSDTQKELIRQFAAEDGDNLDEGKKGFFGKRKK